ncbi:phiSA1p31-related protein [Streptomyces virginiae]|uniref:phiSA1p31-related protein n=1 Tax=Streptomyces virginiae TaxID=1961 RepID=UPI00332C4340
MTFKVGDEVTLSTRRGARASVEYGPYGDDNRVYLVKMLEGEYVGDVFSALAYVMKAVPTVFAVGDKVRASSGRDFKVVAGPFDGPHCVWYALEDSRGKVWHHPNGTDPLTLVERATAEAPRAVQVGDRVRVTEADDDEPKFVGRFGVVKSLDPGSVLPFLVSFGDGKGLHGDDNGRWWCRSVELAPANMHEHDGVTYDLSAQYRDRDGDVWRFARMSDDTVRGNCHVTDIPVREEHDSLAYAVATYGPLTKV